MTEPWQTLPEPQSEPPRQALLDRIERDLKTELRPVKPLRSTAWFVAFWAVIFAAVVTIGVVRLRPLAVPKMGPAESILVVGFLAGCAVLLMVSLARQMSPGSRVSPRLLPVAVLLAAAVLFYALFPVAIGAHFWLRAWRCFSVGISFGAVTAALIWVALRRGAFLNPRPAGATAGLLAGLAGTTLLAIHCPQLEVCHVLAGHVAAAAVGALAGVGIAALFTRRTATRAAAS